MRSDAVTVPPGELTRSTTALTFLSRAAWFICWAKRLTAFSVGWRNPPARALTSMPSTWTIATLPRPLPGWTSSSVSRVELEIGVTRKLGTPQPARSGASRSMTMGYDDDDDIRIPLPSLDLDRRHVRSILTPVNPTLSID